MRRNGLPRGGRGGRCATGTRFGVLQEIALPRLGDRVGMVVVEGEAVCAIFEECPAAKAERKGPQHREPRCGIEPRRPSLKCLHFYLLPEPDHETSVFVHRPADRDEEHRVDDVGGRGAVSGWVGGWVRNFSKGRLGEAFGILIWEAAKKASGILIWGSLRPPNPYLGNPYLGSRGEGPLYIYSGHCTRVPAGGPSTGITHTYSTRAHTHRPTPSHPTPPCHAPHPPPLHPRPPHPKNTLPSNLPPHPNSESAYCLKSV